jgi:hypothetical protein
MGESPALFDEPMGGEGEISEVDETFVGGKAENRAYGSIPPKKVVMSLVQRGGKVRSFHVPNVTAFNLYPIIVKHVHNDSRFMTDEADVYAFVGRRYADHQTVNHSAKEYVRDDVFTNSAEGYFSVLKRGIFGVYFHVSEARLHRYLSKFDFRHSHRVKLGFDDVKRTDIAIEGVAGKRLTYETARSQGAPSAAF